MQTLAKTKLVGFVELKVGSLNVQVPIRSAKSDDQGDAKTPLASFEADGSSARSSSAAIRPHAPWNRR
jgi:hypothetical protein